MKVTEMTRATIELIDADIKAALEPLAEKFGIDVNVRGGTFNNDNFTAKVTFSVISEDGQVMTKEAKAFKDYAFRHGIDKDALFTVFGHKGKLYEIIGFSPRASKYPVLAKSLRDGDTYKFPVKLVAAAVENMKEETV